jgi:cysteine-S-conjugate beta-lyase
MKAMANDRGNPETTAVHAGHMSAEHFGVVNTPVYRASTILYPTLEAMEARDAPFTYGRHGTPSSKCLEDAVTALEGGVRTVLCPSGASAIATAILSVCRAGDHLLMVDSCYGPTRSFCEKFLKRVGVETTYYDPLIAADIEGLFKPNTTAVFCESPGTHTFEVQDIPAIARAAHAKGASVLLDNTWGTPLYFNALAHGVDLSIMAATKYVGGHADLMMGYVCANASHEARLVSTHDDLGLCSSGDDCFLALRGLRTMPLRLKQHQDNGLRLARWLASRSEVERVLHPALENDPGHALWKRDFTGACGLFGVVLKPVSRQAVAAFMDHLELFGMGFSWGGYESLIVTSHVHRSVRPFDAKGPHLRIHAGLENADDLIADLERGFERMRRAS